jgi:signal transduction histidine kinase
VDLVEEVFVSPERWRTLASTLDPGAELEGTAFRWKRRDGSVILVRLSGLVSQSSGEGPVLEMIAENVTELERNRAAALEAEKLRVARQVAVTVAHEFNNPLAVLLAAYDLHVRKLARTADRDTRERISAIPRAVERMRDLVNRLVTINRVREATYTGGTTFLNLNESSGEGEEDSPPPSADPE